MRPNLLFITAHDLGRTASCLGAGVPTPALDACAARGWLFTNASAVAPTCSPSRGAMMTGRYPHENGLTGLAHLGFSLETAEDHLASILSTAGYRTILSGIQHEAADHRALGYREYIGADPHAIFDRECDLVAWDRQNASAVASFLAAAPPSEPPTAAPGAESGAAPWFLSLGLVCPHRPWPGAPDASTMTATWDEASDPPAGLPPTADVRREAAAFRRSVRAMDAALATVFAALDASPAATSTLVVVTSDHGIDFPRYKGTPTDAGLGVVLIVRTPGQRRPAVVHDPVSLIDLHPTLLTLLGVTSDVDGATERPESRARPIAALTGARPRRFLFGETNFHVSYEPTRTVRDDRYRLVKRYTRHTIVPPNIGDSPTKDLYLREAPPIGGPVPGDIALYDTFYDPLHAIDLASSPELASRRDALAAELSSWMRATRDPLIHGEMPRPVGARVADATAYSSWSADALATSGGET